MLLRFIKEMEKEIHSFPSVQLGQGEFVRRLRGHKEELQKMILSGKCTNTTFEKVFGDILLGVAARFAIVRLTTVEEITRLEIELGIMGNRFPEKAGKSLTDEEEAQDDQLLAYLEMNIEHSKQFEQIRNKIKKSKLVRVGAQRMKLLLSGEQDYYAYIKRYGLDEKEVVAILNDQSVRDLDLLFTEKGLVVRDMDSYAALGAKWMLLGPAALLEMGVRAVLSKEVSYADVTYKADKLERPNFGNKEVNMEELIALIDDIKRICVDTSIENKIYRTITSAV